MCIDPSERVDQIHKGRRSTCVCPVTEASSFRHVTGYMVYYYVRYGSMAIWSLAACLVLAKKKKNCSTWEKKAVLARRLRFIDLLFQL
jgi:hypothetical protein